MSEEHSIKVLCAVLSVSRSGYYQWQHGTESPRASRDRTLLEKIVRVHARSRCTYGSPRMKIALETEDEPVGRHRVARLMREAGLQGRQKRRYRVRTTDSAHDHPIAPNLLAQENAPSAPDRIWTSDITYVDTDEGWLYLAGVLDLYSRRLIGWAMGPSLQTTLPLAALDMALRARRPAAGLLHHSDRGCQYASEAYRKKLASHGLRASMSRKANCYDNATIESFWSTLKQELIYRRRFTTRADAATALFSYIEGFYNTTRLHSSLGYKSPLDYESHLN
jgi:transposase InsO family protein